MEVHPLPIESVVDLVNGWGTVPRAKGGDRPTPPGTGRAARIRLADRLYPVFAAAVAAERARLLNDALAECDLCPALGVEGDAIRPVWLVRSRRVAPLAEAVLALRAQLAEHHPERLGVCASANCGDAYVDASPRAHRRYCSVTCQNRERVAAFRRRRSDASRGEPAGR